MADIIQMVKNLREERSRTTKQLRGLSKAIVVLGKLAGRKGLELLQTRSRGPRRKLSAAARRRIAAAQRARWAKWKAKHGKKAA